MNLNSKEALEKLCVEHPCKDEWRGMVKVAGGGMLAAGATALLYSLTPNFNDFSKDTLQFLYDNHKTGFKLMGELAYSAFYTALKFLDNTKIFYVPLTSVLLGFASAGLILDGFSSIVESSDCNGVYFHNNGFSSNPNPWVKFIGAPIVPIDKTYRPADFEEPTRKLFFTNKLVVEKTGEGFNQKDDSNVESPRVKYIGGRLGQEKILAYTGKRVVPYSTDPMEFKSGDIVAVLGKLTKAKSGKDAVRASLILPAVAA